MTTLNDAIDALDRLNFHYDLKHSPNAAKIREFLTGLKAKAEPLHLPTDREGFILEGAGQHGFDHIDDDAEILVVSCQKLVQFITMRESK